MPGASYSIGPRIKIDGEKEFRESIRAINAEYRNLVAQMDATKAAFAGQEKSEKSLTQQKAILTKQIDQQREKLKEEQEQLAKYEKHLKDTNDTTKKSSENVSKCNEVISQVKGELSKLQVELQNVNKNLALSQSKWTAFSQKMQEVSDKTGRLGKSFSTVGGVLTKTVTAPIVAVGAGAVKSAAEVEGGMNRIIKITGATGKTAASLRTAYEGAAKSVSGSLDDIATAVGEVHQRLNLNGKDAQKAAEQFVKFAKVTDTDVGDAIQKVTRMMGDANIPAKQYSKVLDYLTKASQKTGASVDDLAEAVTRYGAPMRQLGVSTQQSIAMFANWEKAGVTTEKAFAGMRIAISGWMKDGKDAGTEFQKTVKGIQDGTISTSQAMEIFGKKGGPDMIDAIKQGRFNLDDFTKSLGNTKGALNETYKNSLSNSDKLKLEMNKLKVSSAGFGASILKSTMPAITRTLDSVSKLAEKFGKLPQPVQDSIIKFGIFAATLGPVASGMGKVFETTSKVTDVLGKLGGKVAAKEVEKLGTAAAGAAPGLESMAGAAGEVSAVGAGAGASLSGIGGGLAAIAPVALPVAGGIAAVAVAVHSYKTEQAEANRLSDNAVQKADTLGRSVDTLSTKVKDIKQNYQDSIAKVQANATVAQGLNDRLQELVQTQGNTAGGQAQISQMVSKLNELVPGLNLQYDKQKNTLSETNKQIKDHIKNMVEEAKSAAQQNVLTQYYEKQYQAQFKLVQIKQQHEANQKKLNEADKEYKQLMKDGGWAAHGEELRKVKDKTEKLKEANEKLNSSEKNVKKAYKEAGDSANAMADLMNQSANKTAGVGTKVTNNAKVDHKAVRKSAKDAADGVSNELGKIPGRAREAGANSTRGFENGVQPGRWSYIGKRSGDSFLTALKKALKIHSPSQELRDVGKFALAGFELSSGPQMWQRLGQSTGQSYLNGLTAAMATAKMPVVAPTASTSTTMQKDAPQSQAKAYTVQITAQKPAAQASGRDLGTAAVTGVNEITAKMRQTGTAQGQGYALQVRNTQPQATTAGRFVATGTNSGITMLTSSIRASGNSHGATYVTAVRSHRASAYSSGVFVSQGLDQGIASQIPQVRTTTNGLVTAVKNTFVKGLGIHSPARVTYDYGRYTGLGFINGLNSTQLGKFTRSTVNDMKGAFAKSHFSTDVNVDYLDNYTPTEVAWMRQFDGGSVVNGTDGGKGGRFVNNMLRLVNDDSHGYSQSNRWGPDYDCSSSIITALRWAGFDTGNASYTGNMSSELTKHGWERLPYKNPKKGDILLNDDKHVEMALGNGLNAGFHSAHGHPEPGDQAREAYVGRDPGGWAAILRYKNGFGDSLADAIEETYNFKKFGYGSLDAEGDDGGAAASGDLGDWVRAALELTHQPMSLAGGLIRAAKSESGGNPRAVNNWDINAKLGHPSKGLMQTIDSTFNAYKVPGHGNIWNPVDNMAAAIMYMIKRYGSVEAVLKPRSKHWFGYDVGSRYVPYDMPAIVHQGEMIIPRSENPYANSNGSITGGFVDAIMNELKGTRGDHETNLTVNVYGSDNQDVHELAKAVTDEIVGICSREGAMI
ncbi:MAG: phage tail tape measure protein [Pseudoramibacter sp.]